jgi:low molecular weight protein-tyrosine phosphatase
MKILMVCLGNICRSPLAEGILQEKAKKAGLLWSVESAGTGGNLQGNPPHHLAQKVARLNNIDISCQRARKFTKEDMMIYDKIYAMSEDVLADIRRIAKENWDEKKVELLLNVLYPGRNKSIPDPWFGGEEDFHTVYKMIDAACDVIINKYAHVTTG